MITSRGEIDRFAPDLALKTYPKPDSGEGSATNDPPSRVTSKELLLTKNGQKSKGCSTPL